MKVNDFWWIFVGAILGTIAGDYLYDNYISEPPKPHLCKCEMCKIQRQLETCEVLDSVFNIKKK
jgi:hypothetical protein